LTLPSHLAWVEVDLDAIRGNFTQLQEIVAPARLMAVVKSDAYGHGLVPVARAVAECGASTFGVASVEEAVALRQAGIGGDVLVICPILVEHADLALEHDFTVAIFDLESAKAMGDRAAARGGRLRAHAKIDTGLGRLSVLPDQALAFVRALHAMPGLDIEGVYSHLADAEGIDQSMTLKQYANFERVLEELSANGIAPRVRHIAGSAAGMLMPELRYDQVRAGIALYGLWPSEETRLLMIAAAHHLPKVLHDAEVQARGVRLLASMLRPALSFKTRVAQVKEVPEGWSVGYGCTYRTRRPTRVAVLPVGYADGYDRHLSNKGHVLVRGRRAPIIGRICMNLTMVDVTDIPGAARDDEAVLLGRQGDDEVSAEEVAADIGTINYEVVTRIRWDLPRVYR
jgi:alanine racemase